MDFRSLDNNDIGQIKHLVNTVNDYKDFVIDVKNPNLGSSNDEDFMPSAYGVFLGDELAGMCYVTPVVNANEHFSSVIEGTWGTKMLLGDLVVNPKYRELGLASRLVAYVLSRYKECTILVEPNDAIFQLMISQGFKEFKYPNKSGKGTAILLLKNV